MAVTVDDSSSPLIHAYGTTAEVLAYMRAQGVRAYNIIAIWDATVGPTNCVYLRT
jgi:hypothetical protein